MSEDPTITVVQHTKKPRYEIIVGGEMVGFTQYEEAGHGVHRYVHTEIDPEHGGHGYAGILVRSALDAEREAGHRVQAQCPYVKKFIQDHPEYQDLLDD
ncbi:GNAT family N-acetyltransferase [Aeromicrobium sp. CTD01-1L150]|uniref:GNAT family N-acetyltransferase n=1 Tax=Aeromicrobium sp. CTD01-1L150 TaxID=3341830 RepID=UPI0035BF990A